MIGQSNAREVLGTAEFLGLPELASIAYELCKASINIESIPSWIEWCDARDQRSLASSSSYTSDRTASPAVGAAAPPGRSTGWVAVEPSSSADYVSRLKGDIYAFITSTLSSHQSSPSDPRFLSIFTILPFELFKKCIEDPSLSLGTDQERFAFAKKVIAARKRNQGAQASAIENVVLQFGGSGQTSNVHVTRKSRQRTLWKVDKE